MFEHRPVEHFSVGSKWLREAKEIRLDASFYNPRVAHAIETLKKSGLTIRPLGELVSRVFFPNRFKRIYVDKEHGIPFLGGRQIVQFQPADMKYLSSTAHKNIPELAIKQGWILITRSGTVGRVTMAPEEWDGWVASEHILRVVPNEAMCVSGYLYAFLTSPVGYIQLTAQIYGAVVDELTEDHVRNVLVPVPKTKEQEEAISIVNDLALKAVKKRAEASRLVTEAVASLDLILPKEEATKSQARVANIMAAPNEENVQGVGRRRAKN